MNPIIDLLDRARACKSEGQLVGAVQAHFAAHFGVRQVYYVTNDGQGAPRPTRILTGSEPAWLNRYVEQGYGAIDPIQAAALHSGRPVWWPEMIRRDWEEWPPEVRQFGFVNGVTVYFTGQDRWLTGFALPLGEPDDEAEHIWRAFGPEIVLTAAHADMLLRRGTRSAEMGLSPRERDCLALVAQGLGTGRIAERLRLSERTVLFHLSNARKKLGARSRAQAAARAARLGLIEP